MKTLLRRIVDVKDDERAAMLVSFVLFFCVLSGWFVIRPIRDEVAAASGVSKLPWLFAGTLTVTLLVNTLFSALVVRYPARKFIPITFHFFAANLFVFYLLFRGERTGVTWTGPAFFVWTSMFNFFITSIFWCFMADVWKSDQAKRLFGFIGLGGTLGSVAGSAATAALAKSIGSANLVLISIALLECAVAAVVLYPSTADPSLARGMTEERDRAIGGSAWAGVSRVFQ